MNQESQDRKQQEEDRSRAVGLGMIVYTGGVVAATAIFIFFILTAFPESAYFIRFLMVLAALCVGFSALAFRYALENWAVYGSHRKAAIGFYYGEIFLVGLNTIVSFSALLYTFSGNELPDWVAWYEPFTVATIAYVILAWGTLFVLDPKAKAKARQLQVLIDFDNQVIDGMSDYLKSRDGLLAIQENANDRIRENFSVRDRSPRPWLNRGEEQAPTTPGIPTHSSPAPLAPTTNRPSLPDPSMLRHMKRYHAGEIVSNWGITIEQAKDLLIQYELFDARSAYDALREKDYLPRDLTADNFMYIYCEIMGVSPTWERIVFAAPHPLQPGMNGKK